MDSDDLAASLGVCVVVGGSGWTGSYIVSQLVKYRQECQLVDKSICFEIHSLDIVSPADALVGLHEGEDSFHECDISDEASVRKLFMKVQPKTVFHTASIVDLRVYPSPTLEKVNVNGTVNLMKTLKEVSNECNQICCFVYTSTFDVVSSMFGIEKATESAPYADSTPSNHYKRTKIIAEKHVRQNASESCLACALRPGHIYGPGDVLLSYVASTPVGLGPASARMSFTYVENLATVHIITALKLYEERRKKVKYDYTNNCENPVGDDDSINGSSFFITDLDANFFDFYKKMSLRKATKIRIPLCIMSFIVGFLEIIEHICILLLGSWYLRHQLQHPVTGLTSAVMESGVMFTALSNRAKRILSYKDERSMMRFVSDSEALLRTSQWLSDGKGVIKST